MLVIFDTNFLLLPFKFKFDLFSQLRELLEGRLELAIISQTKNELNSIKIAPSLKLALEKLLVEKNFETLESATSAKADDALVEISQLLISKKQSFAICTNDRELRLRLKKIGAKTIGLREKSKLCVY